MKVNRIKPIMLCFVLLVYLLFFSFPPLTVEGMMGVEVTEAYPVFNASSLSTKSPVDPTMVFFSMDYGKQTAIDNRWNVSTMCLI